MQVSVTNFRRFFGVFKEIIFLRLTDLYLLVSTIYYILDCINAGCRLHIDERLLFWQVDKTCCRPFFVPWHTILCNCSIRAPLFFIFLKMTNFQQSFFFLNCNLQTTRPKKPFSLSLHNLPDNCQTYKMRLLYNIQVLLHLRGTLTTRFSK